MPTNDVTIKANFAKESYVLTVQANDSNMGTVTGGNTYEFDSPVILTATPNSGYHFVNWTDEDGNEVSTNPTYTFTMSASAKTFIANFAKSNFNVTVQANDTNGGKITIDDNVLEAKYEQISPNAGATEGNIPTFEETEKNSREEGAKLPKTAMNYLNWLLAGLAFILIGFAGYIIICRIYNK